MPRQQSVILDDTEDKEKKAKLSTALKQAKDRWNDLRRDLKDEIKTHEKNVKHYNKELATVTHEISTLSLKLDVPVDEIYAQAEAEEKRYEEIVAAEAKAKAKAKKDAKAEKEAE